MTVEPERTPRRYETRSHATRRRETQAQPQSGQNSTSTTRSAVNGSAATGNAADENTEMLRWRADQLLDEMMIGGIDVSAADLDGQPDLGSDPDAGSDSDRSLAYESRRAPRDEQREDQWGEQHTSQYTESYHSPWNGQNNGQNDVAHNSRAWENGNTGGYGEEHSNQNDVPPTPSGAAPDVTASDMAGPDVDVYFDAYESSYSTPRPVQRPMQRPESELSESPRAVEPRLAPTAPSSTESSATGSSTTGSSADSPVDREYSHERYDRHDSSSATSDNGSSYREQADLGYAGSDYSHAGSSAREYSDGYSRGDANTEPQTRRGEDSSGSLLSSKINEADYLSRRYGYIDGEDTHRGDADFDPDFDHDFDDGMERALGEPKPAQASGVGRTRDNSHTYYERQRVDREERMRSAAHRPEPPLRSNAGQAGQNSQEGVNGSLAEDYPAPRAPSSHKSSPREPYQRESIQREPRRADLYDRESYRGDRGESARSEPSDRNLQRETFHPALLHEELSQETFTEDKPEPEAEGTEWIHQAKEKWNWQDVSGVSKRVEPHLTSGAESLYEFELAGYDRDPNVRREPGTGQAGSAVGAMAMANGNKRSNLLPRMSATSVDGLHQQIDELLEQIQAMLPAGHEYHERAHHLLNKAVSILQSDPMRSAEVEYYMQQVRGIVQRQEQANRLSNMYRERLQRYLGAWLAFSLVLLLARYIFQFEFDAFLAGTFSLDYSGFLLQNAAGFTGSLFAGALGGSIGALLTLMRHSRLPYGYVDRKYGLRGLILPLIGFLVGGIIYLPFGFFYYLIGLDPSLNMIAASIAAVCAFAFGFNQESIYGTRE